MGYKQVARKRQYKYAKSPFELNERIKALEHTIDDMERLPPALGSKWQQGMLSYYRKILAELESYYDADVLSNQGPKSSV